eukprot:TRINITY_DN40545_c0_g1_i1.p1 TRINITY_DN40545_c0_g1~~TRINITY_DN40545_c0_g1_i1.p1  ORF type:complete len:331 (-),score=58.04 TRINITY_DN40545_c0_g1_i1:134-985(-)
MQRPNVALVPPQRRVLVTGGNKGIGYALCKQLAAEHGYQVLVGSRDEGRGQRAIEQMLQADPRCKGKVELLPLDVSKESSVLAAAEEVSSRFGTDEKPLHGIINNAGIGFRDSMEATLAVNIYGAKRVCDAFIPLLCPEEGRIVNQASASGPMFVARCSEQQRKVLTDPDVTWDQLEALMQKAVANPSGIEPYGFSKACLNAYTMFLAKTNPNLGINSCTPGFIDTDITAGMGATKPPDEGTKAAFFCLMGDLEGNGRYYGSDAVRSPLDRYRGPGDPPYVGP